MKTARTIDGSVFATDGLLSNHSRIRSDENSIGSWARGNAFSWSAVETRSHGNRSRLDLRGQPARAARFFGPRVQLQRGSPIAKSRAMLLAGDGLPKGSVRRMRLRRR